MGKQANDKSTVTYYPSFQALAAAGTMDRLQDPRNWIEREA